ncbi:MAG: hypothetical protein AAFX94_15345, partial [Myxococcota bacterium]
MNTSWIGAGGSSEGGWTSGRAAGAQAKRKVRGSGALRAPRLSPCVSADTQLRCTQPGLLGEARAELRLPVAQSRVLRLAGPRSRVLRLSGPRLLGSAFAGSRMLRLSVRYGPCLLPRLKPRLPGAQSSLERLWLRSAGGGLRSALLWAVRGGLFLTWARIRSAFTLGIALTGLPRLPLSGFTVRGFRTFEGHADRSSDLFDIGSGSRRPLVNQLLQR